MSLLHLQLLGSFRLSVWGFVRHASLTGNKIGTDLNQYSQKPVTRYHTTDSSQVSAGQYEATSDICHWLGLEKGTNLRKTIKKRLLATRPSTHPKFLLISVKLCQTCVIDLEWYIYCNNYHQFPATNYHTYRSL